MRRRRGSAILFVMIMLVIMTGVTLTYASLSNATRTMETRREQAVIARLAFDGATLKAAYDAGMARISYPSTQQEVVGASTCSVTISDNSTNLSHSLSMTSTLSALNRTYSDSRVTALKMPESQFFYCLATNTTTNLGSNITLGSAGSNGDLYCTGTLALSGNDTLNGDVEATGSVAQNSATVTGTIFGNSSSIPLPAPSSGNYASFSILNLLNLLFGNHISGETFLTSYSVIYCQGSTTINGTFTGKGIIFILGDVTVNGQMTYSSPTDELAVIATGNVTIQNSNSNIVGYWYCGGTFSASSNLTLTRGCIVTNSLSTSGAFTANYDPTIWNTPGEANRMKLPGFWP
jgi:hypothetical protein